MFYVAEVEDHVRVEPRHFGLATKDAVAEQLEESYVKTMHKELGFVISVIGVKEVGEGIIIPGDGAAYYKSLFTVLVWKPELHELVPGVIKEITNFGAFMQIGPTQGMIHISQTMEDFVSLSKTGNLQGKMSKRSLNVGDSCLARIVAISYKGGEPKIGLTMRQPGLGKVEWLEEAKKKAVVAARKAEKGESVAKKGKKEKKE
ncbi:DNA-directed RNA polymerase [Candidatus Pacearchaeota archaeon]|nr:DNA-directed RNA polymerase [Candidatus Pacearchaeota archaeon]